MRRAYLVLSLCCFGFAALLTAACSGIVPHFEVEVDTPTDIYICPTQTTEQWVLDVMWEEYPKYGFNPILLTSALQRCDVIVQHDPAHRVAYALIMFFVAVGATTEYVPSTGQSIVTIALGREEAVRHEIVHTFGCGHISEAECREQIERHRKLIS